MADRLVTWPMTSRDPKRSRSWPRYISMQISRKRLKIETRFQWVTNRKWHMADRLVTWPMTSRDVERSRSWPQYACGPLSRKWLVIQTRLHWSIYRKWHVGYQVTSRDPEESRWWPRSIWILIFWRALELALNGLGVLWTLSCCLSSSATVARLLLSFHYFRVITITVQRSHYCMVFTQTVCSKQRSWSD